MSFQKIVRSSLSLIVLTGIIISAFFFGSILPAHAEEGTPPPPGEGVVIEPDIVGGAPADPGEWPWQVALVSPTSSDLYNTQFCGGSLIAEQWVVTAAHCVYGDLPSALDVVAGIYNLQNPTSGYQRRNVIQIIVHPNYNASTSDFDIALLKLETPISLGGSGATKTALVPLVPASVGDLNGITSWVTGWGETETQVGYPPQLYEVAVPIISNTTCNDAGHYNGEITSNMLCAGLELGGKDSCQGDSGGPLVVDVGSGWQLAGVVSWGYGCADPHLPGVYTRVSNFTNWINSSIVSTPTQTTVTYRSNGTQDGWVLESGENTDTGGSSNTFNSIFSLGDNGANKQYRGFVSFDTSKLPDNAQITSVTLKLRYGGIAGTNPFTTHGNILVDIRTGSFSGNNSLQLGDFAAVSSGDGVMSIANAPVSNWYSAVLGSGNFGLVNLTGLTQFRLRFSLDDNNDFGNDYLKFYSGNATASYRPQLIIQYTVP